MRSPTPNNCAHWCAPDAEIRRARAGCSAPASIGVTEFEAHIDVFDPQRRLRLMYLPVPDAAAARTTVMVDDFILERAPAARSCASWARVCRRAGVGYSVLAAAHQLAAALKRLKVFVEKHSKAGAPP